ncbi:hypothetical protein OHA28_49970 [Streptomyces sp. NBC_00269]|uniref:hypothetical protein n=1 Tax=unclassified Streptomyces TaxID=2593676 RepID=UPI002E2C22CB|nr:hypothetical protein [Streptomyces sp. NBC_00269]
MELWDWVWKQLNPQTADVRALTRSAHPHFTAASARDELVGRIRLIDNGHGGLETIAELIEARTPPLVAVLGTDILSISKFDENGVISWDGNHGADNDAAVVYAFKNSKVPKIWSH